MNKYLIGAAVSLLPVVTFAQDVPAEGSTLEQIIVAVVVGVSAFVAGWIVKGVSAVEKMVLSSSNKVDDKVLEIVKKALNEALNPQAKK